MLLLSVQGKWGNWDIEAKWYGHYHAQRQDLDPKQFGFRVCVLPVVRTSPKLSTGVEKPSVQGDKVLLLTQWSSGFKVGEHSIINVSRWTRDHIRYCDFAIKATLPWSWVAAAGFLCKLVSSQVRKFPHGYLQGIRPHRRNRLFHSHWIPYQSGWTCYQIFASTALGIGNMPCAFKDGVIRWERKHRFLHNSCIWGNL